MTMELPAAPAWFRFRGQDGVRLGAIDPAGGEPRWFDLGVHDVLALLARGALRRDDLRARITAGTRMAMPEHWEVPVPNPGKILGVAKNYLAHAREFGADAPPEPIWFAKLPDTLVAHGMAVRLPHFLGSRVDHEAELGLILGFADPEGRGRKHVPEALALDLVAGYTAINDVTARKLQGTDRDQKYPWLRSKSFDTFCPIGPWVVPADSLSPADLPITMRVNGELRQSASTAAMVFPVARVLAAMSAYGTLRPGDIIATGTPDGVGPIQPGDRMEVQVGGIGCLRNPVEREPAP